MCIYIFLLYIYIYIYLFTISYISFKIGTLCGAGWHCFKCQFFKEAHGGVEFGEAPDVSCSDSRLLVLESVAGK